MLEVAANRHVRIQGYRFRRVTGPATSLQGLPYHADTIDDDGPPGRWYEPGDDPHGGGFSRAIGTRKSQYLSLFDAEADGLDHRVGAVVLGQAVGLDHSRVQFPAHPKLSYDPIHLENCFGLQVMIF